MFRSFFPHPKWFFLSALAWVALAMYVWFGMGLVEWPEGIEWAKQYVTVAEEGARPFFVTPEKLWTYVFIIIVGCCFPFLWSIHGRNGWYRWSVVGTTAIVLISYFTTQVSVYVNDWYGGFYDLLQKALSEQGSVTLEEFMGTVYTVIPPLMINISVLVLVSFFTKHYLFRWRTALNNYYMHYWSKLRLVEGAAQRVQEDTKRFSAIVETLGEKFVDSAMILIAFLPLLYELSAKVTELPFIGAVSGSLVYVSLLSAIFGTFLLAAVGFKLPGLEFNNQKVEAAYRKELVYGEDDDSKAHPGTVSDLYEELRKNYFRLYFHYMYFGVFRYGYLQFSNFIIYIALGPTIVMGAITFGVFRQIQNAFDKVESSFRYFADSWPVIIDLLSIHKRLRAFEKNIQNDPVPPREEWITDFGR